jgi:uncharacterized protein (DUF2147 family)
MFRRITLAAAAVTMLAVPAFAASYYVGQDAKTHKCAVTSTKPDGKNIMEIGTQSYASKSAAEAALKAAAACK